MKIVPVPELSAKDIARFWAKVQRSADGCWLWIGAIGGGDGGYGNFGIRNRTFRAPRVAWRIHTGSSPDQLVLHKCDNPRCVNPEHLFLGTPLDNMIDRSRKGRAPSGDRNPSRLYPECLPRGDASFPRRHPERLARGEKHGASKLTDDRVRSIRARHANGETVSALAKDFGVSARNVRLVVQRETWRHVA